MFGRWTPPAGIGRRDQKYTLAGRVGVAPLVPSPDFVRAMGGTAIRPRFRPAASAAYGGVLVDT